MDDRDLQQHMRDLKHSGVEEESKSSAFLIKADQEFKATGSVLADQFRQPTAHMTLYEIQEAICAAEMSGDSSQSSGPEINWDEI